MLHKCKLIQSCYFYILYCKSCYGSILSSFEWKLFLRNISYHNLKIINKLAVKLSVKLSRGISFSDNNKYFKAKCWFLLHSHLYFTKERKGLEFFFFNRETIPLRVYFSSNPMLSKIIVSEVKSRLNHHISVLCFNSVLYFSYKILETKRMK